MVSSPPSRLVAGNVLLIFVAVFVYLAATAETQATGLEAAAHAVIVRDIMIGRFESLPETATLDEAEALLRTTQHEFPIIDGGGRLRGVLTLSGLIAACSSAAVRLLRSTQMAANIPVVRDHEKLIKVLEHLKKGSCTCRRRGGCQGPLVGYVIIENIGELMLLCSAVAS